MLWRFTAIIVMVLLLAPAASAYNGSSTSYKIQMYETPIAEGGESASYATNLTSSPTTGNGTSASYAPWFGIWKALISGKATHGVTIYSPSNATYVGGILTLAVDSNETISEWNYSFNGRDNITFTPNITFSPDLGQSNVTVCAFDILNLPVCETQWFTYEIGGTGSSGSPACTGFDIDPGLFVHYGTDVAVFNATIIHNRGDQTFRIGITGDAKNFCELSAEEIKLKKGEDGEFIFRCGLSNMTYSGSLLVMASGGCEITRPIRVTPQDLQDGGGSVYTSLDFTGLVEQLADVFSRIDSWVLYLLIIIIVGSLLAIYGMKRYMAGTRRRKTEKEVRS